MPYWQKNTRIFLPLNLFLIMISLLFFYDAKPVISSESRPMAIMGPLITTGSVDETTQQILFDRLREHLLQRFMLVSHVIVDSIREKGFKSIDIENCRSSKCVNTILDFLDELEARYQTRLFFQLSIHQSGPETHFSLKHTDLRFPEVIRQLKTASCRNCNLPEKKQALDEVSLAMIQVFPKPVPEPRKMVEQEAETLEQEPKLEISKELKEQPLKPAQTIETKPSSLLEITEKPDETETAERPQEPVKLEEEVRKEDHSEKKMQPDPVEVALPEPKDPYEIARDEYNAFLASQLLDITYSLQVFRIGMHVVIQLEIDEEGILLSQKVIQSSGSKDFDETAMIGVEELELKPLPEPLNEYASYKVNLRIQNYQ